MVLVPVDTGWTGTPVPVFIPSAPVLSVQTGVIPAPSTLPATTGPALPSPSPPRPAGILLPNGFMRYTGAEYSLDYPAEWSTSSTTLPLTEYRHSLNDCSVTLAYDLDQELRRYLSPDRRTLFYSAVVKSDRDIWPRAVDGRVAYEDIFNAVLGDPEHCANEPDHDAFTIAGIAQVPVAGVSYPGVRVDFARIENATGYTQGTGTAYIVTGKNHSGVFTLYRTTTDTDDDTQDNLSIYMFSSLRLDPGF